METREYGMTVRKIEDDDVRIDHRVEIPVKSDTEKDISHNQAVALEKFTKLFVKQKYDTATLLGDRYEVLAVAITVGNTRTSIIYISGGI